MAAFRDEMRARPAWPLGDVAKAFRTRKTGNRNRYPRLPVNPFFITPDSLIALAGKPAFERGERYARQGRVALGAERGGLMHATVRGSDVYEVRLGASGGQLSGSCDCPVGLDGDFCKHLVATALCWAGQAGEGEPDTDADAEAAPKRKTKKKAPAAETDEAVLRRWLAASSIEALHELILDLAARDKDAWRAVVARARFAQAGAKELRKAVGQLIGRPRFLDYRASNAYARRIADLPGLLRDHLDTDPASALDLVDYALHRLFAVYGGSDDSGGAIGGIVQTLAELHLRAAIRAQPPAAAFARSYYGLRLADGWAVMGGLDAYAEVLGRTGIGLLERQVAAALEKLPPKPRDAYARVSHLDERYTLDDLQKELAHHGGDIDAVIARKAAEAQHAYHYLELANLCREHGRDRIATEWLERGLKAHPNDARLLDALADTWEREDFLDDALALRWRAFQIDGGAQTYLALRRIAERIGRWPEWREKALAHVDDAPSHRQSQRDAHRIDLHLAEDDIAAAWHIARNASLHPALWARLAPRLEATEPEGALRAYRTLVQASVARAQRQGYVEAIGWIRRMLPLHKHLGTEAALSGYLDDLARTHHAKRTFIELLAAFRTQC